MREVNEIIIHCTATRADQHVTLADINRWHRERGFAKIGYHYVIDRDGRILTGRDEREVGAHCEGRNANSIGIAYIGGLCPSTGKNADTRTKKQKEALEYLIISICMRLNIAQIVGHSEYTKKDCPCFDAANEYYLLIP